MNVIIVGRGAMAEALVKRCKKEKVSHGFWESTKPTQRSVILFCGSGRLFKDVWYSCSKNYTPLVLLSTNIRFPTRKNFPFIFAPNCSEEVLEFIELVRNFADKTTYKKVSIAESHQKTKKGISGTAKLIAKMLGKTQRVITSIRDTKEQKKLGIPAPYLDGHAYHRITFTHDGVSTEFSVTVLGRETYAKGALKIARDLIRGS